MGVRSVTIYHPDNEPPHPPGYCEPGHDAPMTESDPGVPRSGVPQLDELVEEFNGWWHLNREGSVNATYARIDRFTKAAREILEAEARSGAAPLDPQLEKVRADLVRRAASVTRPESCGFQLLRRERENGDIEYQIFADTEPDGTQIAWVQSTRQDAEFIQACLAQAPLFAELLRAASSSGASPVEENAPWFVNLKAARDFVQTHGNRKTRHHLLAAFDEAFRRLRASPGASAPPDVVCQHGTAMDVHCCNCHSGFIFEKDHECPPVGQ
jgi:hypothetical protein